MLRRMLRQWTTRLEIKPNSLTNQETQQPPPIFMHPVVFLSGWAAIGLLIGREELEEISLMGFDLPGYVALRAGPHTERLAQTNAPAVFAFESPGQRLPGSYLRCGLSLPDPGKTPYLLGPARALSLV